MRDVESNFTSVRCSAAGLVLRELCSGLVSTKQRKTQNAAQRASEQNPGQPGPELLLPGESPPHGA